jgi:hypothetical protein
LCTFWPCHPYFILQFYSSLYLWLKHWGISLSRPRVSLRFHVCTSILTVYPQYWQPFTTCTTETMGYGVVFHMYYYLRQSVSLNSRADRVLLSPPVRNDPSGSRTATAPGHWYEERGCVYIKCLSNCIIMYGVHSILWFYLSWTPPPPKW